MRNAEKHSIDTNNHYRHSLSRRQCLEAGRLLPDAPGL